MNLLRILLLISVTSIFVKNAFSQDINGSKDHPLITRYPGSTIAYYEEQKFSAYKIATGPEVGYRVINDWVDAEGKLTRIYYVLKGTTTLTEVYRNFITAFTKAGFKILAQGIDDKSNVSKEIGGRTHLGTFYKSNPFPPSKGITLLQGSSTSGGSCYIAAHLKKNGSSVYVVIGGSQYKSDEKVYMVDIIEETIMEDNLIQINANEMLSGIKENGKIALHNIFFDFDKHEIKPESKPALEEISKLMKLDAKLNIYIVGHSDAKGTLEYNINLSKKRAEAIANELVKNYGIAANRLSAQGVGPLAPMATNRTNEGAALNRRVELVEK